jgi:hypothetical protein
MHSMIGGCGLCAERSCALSVGWRSEPVTELAADDVAQHDGSGDVELRESKRRRLRPPKAESETEEDRLHTGAWLKAEEE